MGANDNLIDRLISVNDAITQLRERAELLDGSAPTEESGSKLAEKASEGRVGILEDQVDRIQYQLVCLEVRLQDLVKRIG